MKESSRFLIGFGIFLAVIVIIAVVISVAGSNAPVKMLPEDSPEGTVQRFLMTVREGDYLKAYGFLSPSLEFGSLKYSYDNWLSSTQSYRRSTTWKASIVKSMVKDQSATVEVAVDVFRDGGLFDDPVSTNHVIFTLQMENGKWMIKSPVDLYWLY